MAWKLRIYFSDGEFEDVDEDFETKEDAEDEFQSWLDNWAAGRETLLLSDPFDEDVCDADIEDCEIWEEKTKRK